MSREAAALTAWLKELAPSEELRRWFAHDPNRWSEFRERYRRELQAKAAQPGLRELARRADNGPVTLVFAACDPEWNNAPVFEEVLEEGLATSREGGQNATLPLPDLCCRIIQEARDAVIFADPKGVIRLWNRGAAEIFGYAAAEAVGHSLDIIIPERHRERHGQGCRRVMAAGVRRCGSRVPVVPGRHRDGRPLSLACAATRVRDDGRLGGAPPSWGRWPPGGRGSKGCGGV